MLTLREFLLRRSIQRRSLFTGMVGGFLADPAVAAPSVSFSLVQVDAGIYLHVGEVALTTPENAGDIANLGVVVGDDAVAVIDTGGSVAVGEALLAAIRRVTDKPIRYVVNTHEHPDHLFGNAAFAETGCVFVGHRALPASLATHGPHYLRSFREQLGDAAIERVRLIPPTRLVDGADAFDLGNRVLRLRAWKPAHTDCDLTIVDERTGTLFAGDLLFVQHIPVVDGSLKGWIAELPALAELPAQVAIPGHGRRVLAWPDGIADERRYLEALAADTRRAVAAGTALEAAVGAIGAGERGRWELFDDYNPRNATKAFSELEWE